MTRTPPTQIAIDAAGGVAELARHLGITTASVSGWRRIPATRVLEVATITGIPPHVLRPDVYPRPEAA